MIIRQVVNTVFRSCSYIIAHDGISWLVDCGDVQSIVPVISGRLAGVLLTHAHFDHIYGLNGLLNLFPDVPVLTNQSGKETLADDKLNLSRYHETPFVLERMQNVCVVDDNQLIDLFGDISAQAVYTPGHSPCCVTWVLHDAIFTGDSYIPGVKTVTNLPHADKALAQEMEEQIRQLAVGRRIYSGHSPLFNDND